jgi:hypothetical protein
MATSHLLNPSAHSQLLTQIQGDRKLSQLLFINEGRSPPGHFILAQIGKTAIQISPTHKGQNCITQKFQSLVIFTQPWIFPHERSMGEGLNQQALAIKPRQLRHQMGHQRRLGDRLLNSKGFGRSRPSNHPRAFGTRRLLSKGGHNGVESLDWEILGIGNGPVILNRQEAQQQNSQSWERQPPNAITTTAQHLILNLNRVANYVDCEPQDFGDYRRSCISNLYQS